MKQKKLPNRQSMRLQGYDYSTPGFYIITICTQNMQRIFGDLIDGKMHLKDFGVVVGNEWFKKEAIRDNINLDAFVIMPNHVHGIIEIIDKNPIVGANRDSALRYRIFINDSIYRAKFESPSNNLGAIIRGYKSAVTKQINQIRKTPGAKTWERGYYDHIIRNEESLFHIREYIKCNPMNWNKDRFYQNR